MSLTGRCACGAVRFRIDGEPAHVAYCHCVDCRRATGAPVAHWVGVPRARVSFAGEVSERAGTGAVTRGFCERCGSALTYADGTIEADEVYLAGGTFDDPSKVPPTRHAYWSQRAPFLAITDDLPKYASTSRRRRDGPEPERVP